MELSDVDLKLVKDLDAVLEKMPEYEGTLYRSVSDFGIEDVDAFVKSHLVGECIALLAYTSTSTKIYDDNFPIQYIIISKSGEHIQNYNKKE